LLYIVCSWFSPHHAHVRRSAALWVPKRNPILLAASTLSPHY